MRVDPRSERLARLVLVPGVVVLIAADWVWTHAGWALLGLAMLLLLSPWVWVSVAIVVAAVILRGHPMKR